MYVYLNSRLIPAAAATVSVYDRAFAFGDSLVETLKISHGRPVFFHDHFLRLIRSMAEARFETRLDEEGLMNQALSLAELNEVGEGRLRIQLSRGTPILPAGVDPAGELTPTLLLTAEPFSGFPGSIYSEGAVCGTVPFNRGLYARFKSGSLFPTVLARLETAAAGAQEAIFTSGHGRLLETSLANIFFLMGNRIHTAGEEQPILAGVTRAKVIPILEEMGFELVFEAPKPGELRRGEDGAFLTSSVLGICPVKSIDDLELRVDAELTGRLNETLRALESADISEDTAK